MTGSILVAYGGPREAGTTQATEKIAQWLEQSGATVDIARDEVRFERPFFTSGQRRTTAIFDSGTLRLETEDLALRVRYEMSTKRFMAMVTGLVALMMAFAAGQGMALRDAAALFPIGWLWLFGMNYLFAWVGFRWRLKQVLAE